jgi:hypothetical protein
MRKRVLRAAPLAALLVVGLAACSGGGSLTISNGAGGATVLPTSGGGQAAQTVKLAPFSDGWAYSALGGSTPVITDSCASTTFCVAVDNAYDAYTFNGNAWTGPVVIDQAAGAAAQNGNGPDYVSVSCGSPQFCVAVDGTHAYTFNGSSWSAPKVLSEYGGLEVSCREEFCLAMDDDGNAYTYASGAWTTHKGAAPDVQANGQQIPSYQVSCASAAFCAAASVAGTALTYNGASFSAPVAVDSTAGAASGLTVSCPSAAFCMAVDASQAAFTFDGTSWHASAANAGAATDGGLACASATACLMVDNQGNVTTFNGSQWNLDESFQFAGASDGNLAAGVSCPSPTLCVTVGEGHYGVWH